MVQFFSYTRLNAPKEPRPLLKQTTQLHNKEASRLYAELLLCVCWHNENI